MIMSIGMVAQQENDLVQPTCMNFSVKGEKLISRSVPPSIHPDTQVRNQP